jgi:glycosyltransferase involved in cell wall biosynthesis
MRGGERTFAEMARTFPRADLALLFRRGSEIPADLENRKWKMTFLNLPWFGGVSYRLLAPLMPMAVATIRTGEYDAVLSSSSGWTHGVRHQLHLSYMYSPPRYLWLSERVPFASQLSVAAAWQTVRPVLRRWDWSAAQRVTSFAAISATVRDRIKRIYGKDAIVIYPPVDVARMRSLPSRDRQFALTVAELVPYKRLDAAILAAKAARVRLIIVGEGPERARLAKLAEGSDVVFAGRVTESRVVELMARARVFLFPATEDFGIATVEALASGTPVVGVNKGGTGEIVQAGMGELVDEPDVDALASAILAVWNRDYDRPQLQRYAAGFAPARFRTELERWVTQQSDGRIGT